VLRGFDFGLAFAGCSIPGESTAMPDLVEQVGRLIDELALVREQLTAARAELEERRARDRELSSRIAAALGRGS
jgi:hypothetical protein